MFTYESGGVGEAQHSRLPSLGKFRFTQAKFGVVTWQLPPSENLQAHPGAIDFLVRRKLVESRSATSRKHEGEVYC